MRRTTQSIAGLFLLTVALANSASAQPYDFYVDPATGVACDLINAANVELVVYTSTGEFVIVTGPDVFLGDSFVDGEGFVFFEGEPFGVIGFADDGDGLPAMWWLTDFGTVVELDLEFFLPFDSGFFPDEFVGVPCDACPFWDNPAECEDVFFDSDDDGVFDEDDFCPDTPLGAEVDFDGCACFELDGDGDGIDDCDDFCPDTFPTEIIDVDGCSCEDLDICDCFFDSDLDGVADCDDFCFDTPIDAFVDIDGCACFELDDDDDGIDDCDDECPNSPRNADVDVDGCTVVTVNPGPINIACGNFSALMLGLTFTGLFMMRFTGRRGQ